MSIRLIQNNDGNYNFDVIYSNNDNSYYEDYNNDSIDLIDVLFSNNLRTRNINKLFPLKYSLLDDIIIADQKNRFIKQPYYHIWNNNELIFVNKNRNNKELEGGLKLFKFALHPQRTYQYDNKIYTTDRSIFDLNVKHIILAFPLDGFDTIQNDLYNKYNIDFRYGIVDQAELKGRPLDVGMLHRYDFKGKTIWALITRPNNNILYCNMNDVILYQKQFISLLQHLKTYPILTTDDIASLEYVNTAGQIGNNSNFSMTHLWEYIVNAFADIFENGQRRIIFGKI
jgi:hypothetical protein